MKIPARLDDFNLNVVPLIRDGNFFAVTTSIRRSSNLNVVPLIRDGNNRLPTEFHIEVHRFVRSPFN